MSDDLQLVIGQIYEFEKKIKTLREDLLKEYHNAEKESPYYYYCQGAIQALFAALGGSMSATPDALKGRS